MKAQLLKLIAVSAVAAAVIFGQGRMESALPGRFEASLTGSPHFSRMDVVLTDTTGLVREMRAGGEVRGGGSVAMVPTRNDLIVVQWLSGGCHDYAQLSLRPLGDRYELRLSQSSTPLHGGGSCHLLAGFPRSVTLTLSNPVPPEWIVFKRG